jgi:hypothetical protein
MLAHRQIPSPLNSFALGMLGGAPFFRKAQLSIDYYLRVNFLRALRRDNVRVANLCPALSLVLSRAPRSCTPALLVPSYFSHFIDICRLSFECVIWPLRFALNPLHSALSSKPSTLYQLATAATLLLTAVANFYLPSFLDQISLLSASLLYLEAEFCDLSLYRVHWEMQFYRTLRALHAFMCATTYDLLRMQVPRGSPLPFSQRSEGIICLFLIILPYRSE